MYNSIDIVTLCGSDTGDLLGGSHIGYVRAVDEHSVVNLLVEYLAGQEVYSRMIKKILPRNFQKGIFPVGKFLRQGRINYRNRLWISVESTIETGCEFGEKNCSDANPLRPF